MPPCRTSSPPSPRSSIELTGSRLVAAALVVLGALAGLSLMLSAAPGPVAAVLALSAVVGGGLAARRELRRPPVRLDFLPSGAVHVDGAVLDAPRLQWQGPIAILDGRAAGRRLRVLGWPDVVTAPSRRELRLWALESRAAQAPAAMAP